MIRPATADDVAVIHTMILEMATEEEAADQIFTDEKELRGVLFVIGYALWCLVYCTWRGLAVHIDDVHVRSEGAGDGHDTALLSALAGVCAERGYRHMEWWANTGDARATACYESLGAEQPSLQGDDLTIFRLSGKPLADLGVRG